MEGETPTLKLLKTIFVKLSNCFLHAVRKSFLYILCNTVLRYRILSYLNEILAIFNVVTSDIPIFSAANKYSFADHHEQKNKKTTGQIKFSVVTIKQRIKLVLTLS